MIDKGLYILSILPYISLSSLTSFPLHRICNAKNYAYETRTARGHFMPEARYEPSVVRSAEEIMAPTDVSANSWLSETR